MTDNSQRILLVGDVMIRDRVAAEYWQPDHPFPQVVRYLSQDGLTVANLEMPLSTRGVPMPKWSNLSSHPDVIEDIRRFGIDAVSLANNHMFDYGPDALFDTLEACDRAGLLRCGAGKDIEEALAPATLDANGTPVCVLGVATTLPIGSDARQNRPGIAPVHVAQSFHIDPNLLAEQPGMLPKNRTVADAGDQEAVCDQIRALKRDGTFVIVMMHWGVPEHWLSPYTGLLAEYQQPLGHALIDAGADVICGHHSHTLHPIELYRGRPIFYSLGNFLFERPRAFMEPASFVVEIVPGPQPEITLKPVKLDAAGFPYLLGDDDARKVVERLDLLSRPFGTAVSYQRGSGKLHAG